MVMTPDLELFASLHADIVAARDAVGHLSYWANPLMVLGRVAAGGFTPERYDDVLYVYAGPHRYVLPLLPDRGSFYMGVIAAVRRGVALDGLPGWVLQGTPLATTGTVTERWVEFLAETTAIQTYAGKRFHSTRNLINRLRGMGEVAVVDLLETTVQERLALNALWEDQMRERGQKIVEHGSTGWLLEHWPWVAEHVAGAVGRGVRLDGRLVALNLSARLSETVWVCNTEKYDRSIPGANHLAFQAAALCFDAAAIPTEQDGPGSHQSDGLAEGLSLQKHRIATRVYTPWRLTCR
jgi:Phosphatidylglycerol lysyltransferase, C-terminal